jgi:hypothetical protein
MLRYFVATLIVVTAVSATLMHAQFAGNPLVGTWKIVEADGRTGTDLQPSLFLFTPKHYSILRVTEARPKPAPHAETDADKLGEFDGFTANSGTYVVSGNVLTTTLLVAKNEWAMAGGFKQHYEIRKDGAALILSTTSTPTGQRTTMKLERVE